MPTTFEAPPAPADWSPADNLDQIIINESAEHSAAAAAEVPAPELTPGPAAPAEDFSHLIGPTRGLKKKCLSCGKYFKGIKGHIRRKHAAGDSTVAQERVKRVLAQPVNVLAPSVGMSLTLFLLQWAQRMRPELRIPGSPAEPKPGQDFLDRAAVAHQAVIEEYLGDTLNENSNLVNLGLVYLEFYMANFNALSARTVTADDISDRPTGSG